MDLETENRIAAILLKEANELRRQAQSEGALAYLRQPAARSRPNSRFLAATVLGVQQANRAVEVNEMWRLREKQIELDDRLKARRRGSSSGRNYKVGSESRSSGCNGAEPSTAASNSSNKGPIQDLHSVADEGLRNDEIEEFLHSRVRRGRGAIGSRMDETGPYLPSSPGSKVKELENPNEEVTKPHVLLGPEKPFLLKSNVSSDDEFQDNKKQKENMRSSKRHRSKHTLKEEKSKKNKNKKRPREEKRRKRHK